MINIKEDNTQFSVNIQDIPIGKTFKSDNKYYLKTNSQKEIRAILGYGTNTHYGILNLNTGIIEYDYYIDVIPVEINIFTKQPAHYNDLLFDIPIGTTFEYKEKYYMKSDLEQNISEDPGEGKLYGIIDISTGELTYEDGYEKVIRIDMDATIRIKTKRRTIS